MSNKFEESKNTNSELSELSEFKNERKRFDQKRVDLGIFKGMELIEIKWTVTSDGDTEARHAYFLGGKKLPSRDRGQGVSDPEETSGWHGDEMKEYVLWCVNEEKDPFNKINADDYIKYEDETKDKKLKQRLEKENKAETEIGNLLTESGIAPQLQEFIENNSIYALQRVIKQLAKK